MTRVLVTGATAPLGAALVRALLRTPSVEHVVACGAEPRPAGLPDAPGRLSYHAVDLTRARDVRELLFGPAADAGIDSLVHLAMHRRATGDADRAHALHVDATHALLHVCARHPTLRRFVLRSGAEVYRVRSDAPDLLAEDAPLELAPDAPPWLRDRVEADLLACAAFGTSRFDVVVLRLAECVAPGTGSQLYDQLQSRVCLLPAGYDPMVNLLSVADAVRAFECALRVAGHGVFNIPGKDTLPLGEVFARAGRRAVAVPGPLLGPLYRLRAAVRGTDFRYDLNRWRFHFSSVMDGHRAREHLGYVPQHGLAWSELVETPAGVPGSGAGARVP